MKELEIRVRDFQLIILVLSICLFLRIATYMYKILQLFSVFRMKTIQEFRINIPFLCKGGGYMHYS